MTEKSYTSFRLTVENRIASIGLDRPTKLNALTFKVYRELTDCFYDLRFRDDVDVVVIGGEGRGFCAGGDVNEIIGELQSMSMKEVLEFTRMTGELIRNMRDLDKPIIAAVHGVAAGAGAVIALASDFRVFADTASIAFLFVKVGLTGADMGAAFLLPRVIGMARATELLMLGDSLPAARAFEFGLANKVVPIDRVREESLAYAKRLVAGPMYAIRMTKKMMNAEWTMDIGAAIEAEAQAQALMIMGNDHKEFFKAYGEKRPPAFKGE